MSHPLPFTQPLSDCRDTSLVGGKAANLGRLIRAGFPVPNGFVVTTQAYRHAQSQSPTDDLSGVFPIALADEICQAYRAMGGGRVAVRSSATAEDSAAASMAGQYETFLDVQGDSGLLHAVRQCWASLSAPRALAYLREHEIDSSCVAMAVVVQRLVQADVAGVLFTTNPHDGGLREMLVEAGLGLGEAVVSGLVQPDTLRVDQDTGRVLAATIADRNGSAAREDRPADDPPRLRSCLNGHDVYRLWQMGRRAVDHFGAPQDIEWAIHAGRLYVLQSRPITTLDAVESRKSVLQAARQRLRQESAAGRGPWALHNLAETLSHPTPLTWSVIGRFMSGAGGLGAMYRLAGFEPSATAVREGFLERIAGRVYMDASRAAEMFFEDFPFAYAVEELERSPDASQTPPTLPRGSLSSRWKARRRLAAARSKLRFLSIDYDRRLRDTIFPAFARYVAEAKQVDLQRLSTDRLIECWQEREKQVLDTFGGQSLMPSFLCEMAIAELRTFLAESFWDEDPDALAHLISSGGPPDGTVMRDVELYEVGKGSRSLEVWLNSNGHRGGDELELAAPRWREPSEVRTVRDMAARLAAGEGPLERHRRNVETVKHRMETLRQRLPGRDRMEFDRRVDLVRRYIAFREDGKDFLILGYELLREVALEAGQRLGLGQHVFFLTREELFDALRVGFAPLHLIERQKAAYKAESRLMLPRVIDERAIDALGDVEEREPAAGGHKAFVVSAGEASGPARVLHSPREAGDLGCGYILVCPSTDPSWTPLFGNAAGLVLERGGILSHGAVVAREMGLPAVVLPDATRRFHDGEEICVDGCRGWVGTPSESCGRESSADAVDPDDVRVAHKLVPPPPGRKDRTAARLRNRFAVVWTIFLLATFLLPESWARQPALAALDLILWPIVRALGKPATVAILAAGIAAFSLLAQKLLTDNRRLLEAKRRAAALNELASALPNDSPRRGVLLGLAAPVQVQGLLAAMVPVGILLGPMVMSFVWLQQRIDLSVASAPPGSTAHVVATVDSDWSEPVQLVVPPPMVLDGTTPNARTVLPIRKTLDRLLALYRQPRNLPGEPWEMRIAPDLARDLTADDLEAYLAVGVPPQTVTWLVRPPEGCSGRFPVTVTAAGHPPVTVNVVLGEVYPPTRAGAKGAAGSPIKELHVVYPKSRAEPVFWQPLARLAGDRSGPFIGRLASISVGWLLLYILVYLATLMLVRTFLKVA